ncbi:Oidioi.mRNA.OKI2018_I69.XSR.g13756.t1.cds [Oikopleura dioica]|uniref:Oidioi.mRNA.OKI2018_I69.XSR.g13756.t1.cds n=1 Tax=Oikopleura dioica TaxID=34765 RepID=A0ABN7SGD3_OIKDI|nr:Oidioi.mRNA.OKI2018_I69.XSR.g13756.t1.cds [Oikopleura dioica]
MTQIEESRICVKNLTKNCDEKFLREFFSRSGGKITDCRLLKNEDGVSRRIAFIGFARPEDAQRALNELNGAKVGVNKIKVELAKDFRGNAGSAKKARKEKPKNDKKAFIEAKVDKDLVDSDDEEDAKEEEKTEDVADTGRLFLRNLSYLCTETDLKGKCFEPSQDLLSSYGTLTELVLPTDETTKRPKGFAFVEYQMPENAVRAMAELDGSSFQGRIMHVLPGREAVAKKNYVPRTDPNLNTSYKKEKMAKMKENADKEDFSWNSLFVGANAVADEMSKRYQLSKDQIMKRDDVAVQLALGESQIVSDISEYLKDHGVKLDTFKKDATRSDKIILVKNLPSGALPTELRFKFEKFGGLGRIIMPPSGLAALVEFDGNEKTVKKRLVTSASSMENSGAMIFVKNVNFATTDEGLKELFEKKVGKVAECSISKRLERGKYLSMGYGWVKMASPDLASKAVKTIQGIELDGHRINLKISKKEEEKLNNRQEAKNQDQPEGSSKIMVRNVPFQCQVPELEQLFSTFGELKFVRMPKNPTGKHRGFAFVEYKLAADASSAFAALKLSTHIYGRSTRSRGFLRRFFSFRRRKKDNGSSSSLPIEERKDLMTSSKSSIKDEAVESLINDEKEEIPLRKKSEPSRYSTASSSSSTCPICFDTSPVQPEEWLLQCHPTPCINCLVFYCHQQIDEGKLPTCMSCPEPIHPCDAKRILESKYFEKYNEISVRHYLHRDRDTRWCPKPDCGFALIANDFASCPKINCQRKGCNTSFCYHCRGNLRSSLSFSVWMHLLGKTNLEQKEDCFLANRNTCACSPMIGLMAGVAIPATIVGVPIWTGRQIRSELKKKSEISKGKRRALVGLGSTLAFLLSPLVAGVTVGVGVPVIMMYVYGVIPITLCRTGGCGIRVPGNRALRLLNRHDAPAQHIEVAEPAPQAPTTQQQSTSLNTSNSTWAETTSSVNQSDDFSVSALEHGSPFPPHADISSVVALASFCSNSMSEYVVLHVQDNHNSSSASVKVSSSKTGPAVALTSESTEGTNSSTTPSRPNSASAPIHQTTTS